LEQHRRRRAVPSRAGEEARSVPSRAGTRRRGDCARAYRNAPVRGDHAQRRRARRHHRLRRDGNRVVSVPTAPEAPAPSHRKIWIAGAFALGVLAVLLWLETPVRNGLQSAWFDGLQVASPRAIESMPATVVAIDEKSLAELG